jgi:ATP-dependent Clp protease ATP-binding subunit ClpC
LDESSSFAAEILQKNKATAEVVKNEVVRINAGRIVDVWVPKLSNNLKEVIEKSAIVASKYKYQFIGTEHFLYSIVDQPIDEAKTILLHLRVSTEELKKNLLSIFENVSRFPDFLSGEEKTGQIPEEKSSKTPALDYFTTDLSKRVDAGKIDPLIGRKQEIERLISILNRRTKNNPVLIGEPGVGKTAIVEGLALAISKHEVPEALADKRILTLDMALVVAGSMFRGEFEQRLKQVIDEARDNSNIILFIDELHTIVGAGATQGSLDAANILKPALARGEIRVIGATTLAEYKKHIEHDTALERRFQPILIEEPTIEESYIILEGLKPSYEQHHNVTITNDAIKSAVDLSVRYITDRFLPDKALDLIDETAAYYKTINAKTKNVKAAKKLESELQRLEEEKTKAVMLQDFTTALHLKTQEDKLKQQLAEYRKVNGKKSSGIEINAEDIARTVAMITKIPISKLLKTEAKKLVNLEKTMQSQIVGQDEATKIIASAIRRSRAGITSPKRPIASFLFLGPTGVGKTETAKVLAQEVFEDREALIRVDMSEFMERHNVSRLIGAPAGYVGYEEGGRLTEEIRRRPYAVILFDEIEKAHPDVFNILLQILEEGQLTDAAGKRVNFRNTIIIMTSNIGISDLNRQASDFGFSAEAGLEAIDAKRKAEIEYDRVKENVLASLKNTMRPELLNRIDKILVFHPLSMEEIKKITVLEAEKLAAHIKQQHNITLTVPREVIRFIADHSFDPQQGARLIRRNIQDLVEDPLAEMLINGDICSNNNVRLGIENNKIAIRQIEMAAV